MCAMAWNSQADCARCRTTIERVSPGGGNTVERAVVHVNFISRRAFPLNSLGVRAGSPGLNTTPTPQRSARPSTQVRQPRLHHPAPGLALNPHCRPALPCAVALDSLFLLCAHSRTVAVLVRPAPTPRPRLSGAHHSPSVGRCTRFKAPASSFINIHCTANTFYAFERAPTP
ncbi:hypothetical protein BC567DRAFT_78328 [Phyllosticta citribraziliensis]